MAIPYTPLAGGSSSPHRTDRNEIRLDDSPPPPLPRRSLDSDSDESDIIYRDTLDDDPFPPGENEKDDPRFKHEGRMEDGDEGQGHPVESRRLRPRKRSKRVLVSLIGVVAAAAFIGLIAGTLYSAPTYYAKSGSKHITMDDIFNGTFAAQTKTLDWVKEDDGDIILSTVRNMTETTLLVNATNVLDQNGERLVWTAWRLSADAEFVLFRSDTAQQWRHSTKGNYWIHRLSDSTTFPLVPHSHPPTVALVKWSPIGHALAYVMENDLYVVRGQALGKKGVEAIRVTEDGSATVFNGVPDWVYEEEVFATDSAMWWSPDGETIAYLRSDESNVKDYRLQYYNPTNDAFAVNQYMTELDMKYPKPGTPNPLVSVHTFSLSRYAATESVSRSKAELSWEGAMPVDERIITEVAWVAPKILLVKELDRSARRGSAVVFEDSSRGKVTRKMGKDGEEGDDGWVDSTQAVAPLPGKLVGYVDIVPYQGFNHIALFSPANATEPYFLTQGDWEVTEIASINPLTGIVYFVAARPSVDRHLFQIPLPTSLTEEFDPTLMTPLTNSKSPGYHDVSFSPGSGHYVLLYRGPDIPWQRVMTVQSEPGKENSQLLEGNEKLNQTVGEFARPFITRSILEINGFNFNMLEMQPSNLETSGRKKYPVLIRVYGGPGSQTVSSKWERDWHTYLVTEKKYVIIMVDGRGTGWNGRAQRNPVMDDLGHWEVVDQVAVARAMAKRVYVDTERIGIWGWSYGGYMTCRTIEADSGVFTLGMAVAPVTNWLYYDSIYTERYMSTPKANADGYLHSAVNNVTAFGKVNFLLAHGSGDDNVHYMNSASLVDKLTQEHVRGWRFRMFTDSNHAMNKREAFREVYEWMTSFLDEKWGRGGTIKHL